MKDQKVFGFAGLYDVWKDRQTGKEIHTYTIITTEPNEVVGEFHDRMPVILQREDEGLCRKFCSGGREGAVTPGSVTKRLLCIPVPEPL